MNIFILDKNPKKAAEYHCDKHVIKMILETSQLLCSVFYYRSNIIPPYKLTHKNHPCSVWVRESKSNFEWTYDLLLYLLLEYNKRYNKNHKCEQIIEWITINKNRLTWDKTELSSFVLAMPEIYKNEDPVKSYRDYYINDKSRFAKWRLNNKPNWFLK